MNRKIDPFPQTPQCVGNPPTEKKIGSPPEIGPSGYELLYIHYYPMRYNIIVDFVSSAPVPFYDTTVRYSNGRLVCRVSRLLHQLLITNPVDSCIHIIATRDAMRMHTIDSTSAGGSERARAGVRVALLVPARRHALETKVLCWRDGYYVRSIRVAARPSGE